MKLVKKTCPNIYFPLFRGQFLKIVYPCFTISLLKSWIPQWCFTTGLGEVGLIELCLSSVLHSNGFYKVFNREKAHHEGLDMVISINRGTPIARWMVCGGSHSKIWMINRGYPHWWYPPHCFHVPLPCLMMFHPKGRSCYDWTRMGWDELPLVVCFDGPKWSEMVSFWYYETIHQLISHF